MADEPRISDGRSELPEPLEHYIKHGGPAVRLLAIEVRNCRKHITAEEDRRVRFGDVAQAILDNLRAQLEVVTRERDEAQRLEELNAVDAASFFRLEALYNVTMARMAKLEAAGILEREALEGLRQWILTFRTNEPPPPLQFGPVLESMAAWDTAVKPETCP